MLEFGEGSKMSGTEDLTRGDVPGPGCHAFGVIGPQLA